MDVNFLAAGYSHPAVGSAGSGIYAGKDGPLVTIMPMVPTTEMLVAEVAKKSAKRPRPAVEHVWEGRGPITATRGANALYSVHDDSSSGMFLKRDYLEAYETVPLTEAEYFSEHKICHNEFCCEFQVAMHANNQGQNSSGEGYVYRLAVFDGVRSFTYATGGVQVCAVISCAGSNLSSCGYLMEADEQESFLATFDYINISGNFRSNNTTQLPSTLVQGHGVLSPQTFEFTREEILEKSEVRVNMRTRGQTFNLLTFAIFGRDFLKDGTPASEPPVDETDSGTGMNLLSPITILLCLNSYLYAKLIL
jgi:hypothetical protein